MIESQQDMCGSKPRENILLRKYPPMETLPVPIRENAEHWYAMRATYRRELDAMARLKSASLGCFIPMQYHFRLRHGRRVKELVPVVRNLLFVHARPSDLRRVKDELPYLQYITDTRSHEKIIVPDAQMRHFIAAAGTYSDQLLYFRPEEVNLSKGTRVRVTGGDFAGREGVFVKVKGARDRRVVIAIEGVIAVALATIHPDLIEPIPV